MLKNYIKIAFRTLLRKKFYSALNILGLAIGLACCMLIVLYIHNELTYNRFHTKADRIYRVGTIAKLGDNDLQSSTAPVPLAQAFAQEFPQIEEIVRFMEVDNINVKVNNNIFSETKAVYADSSFFKVFDFKLTEGNPDKALAVKDGVVLTHEAAERYFGRTSNLIGSLITVNGKLSKVSGVVENAPQNSSLKFNMLIPAVASEFIMTNKAWTGINLYTFMLLKEGIDISAVETQYPALVRKYVGPQIHEVLGYTFDEFLEKGSKWTFYTDKLTDMHLKPAGKGGEMTSRLKTIYIFGAIAVFILALACINFMNLATARSADRAKEVGIRKVLGSVRTNLIYQFIAEAIIITGIAMVLAIVLSELALSGFNQLSGKELSITVLFQPASLTIILLSIIIIGFLAGSYPAFYLTSFKPVEVLKGKLYTGKSNWLRSSLVVFQFCVSIALIVCTTIVYNQLNYMKGLDLGYEKENILILKNGYSIGGKEELLKDQLSKISGIKSVSVTSSLPLLEYFSTNAFRKLDGSNLESVVVTFYADYDFTKTFNLKIKEGRDFNPDLASDSNSIIVNEAAAKKLGYTLGQEIDQFEDPRYKVIGIVDNFNVETLKAGIEPLVIVPDKRGPYIAVKLAGGESIKETLSKIEPIWKSLAPDAPFEYTFLDEDLASQYQSEQQLGKIFTLFTGLAILIACLGLFGLAAFTAEQRTKEIGIRKVLGASVTGIVSLLSKDFLKLVILANIIAWPLAWYAMHKWLEDFAYRINISPLIFVLAGVIALVIALLTVSFQAIKAAVANPVKSLRTE